MKLTLYGYHIGFCVYRLGGIVKSATLTRNTWTTEASPVSYDTALTSTWIKKTTDFLALTGLSFIDLNFQGGALLIL